MTDPSTPCLDPVPHYVFSVDHAGDVATVLVDQSSVQADREISGYVAALYVAADLGDRGSNSVHGVPVDGADNAGYEGTIDLSPIVNPDDVVDALALSDVTTTAADKIDLHEGYHEAIREVVDDALLALFGYVPEWSGDVDPLVSHAASCAQREVVRQLIENGVGVHAQNLSMSVGDRFVRPVLQSVPDVSAWFRTLTHDLGLNLDPDDSADQIISYGTEEERNNPDSAYYDPATAPQLFNAVDCAAYDAAMDTARRIVDQAGGDIYHEAARALTRAGWTDAQCEAVDNLMHGGSPAESEGSHPGRLDGDRVIVRTEDGETLSIHPDGAMFPRAADLDAPTAIAEIVRVLRRHDGEAIGDLTTVAEIVALVPEVSDRVRIGADK